MKRITPFVLTVFGAVFLVGRVLSDQVVREQLPDGVRVSFVLRPTAKSKIRCEMFLPPADKWDGRLWGFGNGYWGGSVFLQRCGQSATVMTDLGTSEWPPETNAVPQEIRDDFGWRSTHLMTVEAKRLVCEYYGRPAHHAYFTGSSTGGGQGFCEAQRYPGDYDGIYAGVPAFDRVSLATPEVRRERLKRQYGKWFTPEEEDAVYEAELAYFARTDPEVARGRFIMEPRITPEKLDGCWAEILKRNPSLADREQPWRALFEPVFANGRRLAPGVQLGCEFRGASDFLLRKLPQVGDKAYGEITDDDLCAFADDKTHNFKDIGAMKRYFQRGGKMLIDAALEDTSVPERAITEFIDAMGPDEGYLYFRIPGRTHIGSPDRLHRGRLSKSGWIANVTGLMQDWVEKGIRPETVTVPLYGCKEKSLVLKPYVCPATNLTARIEQDGEPHAKGSVESFAAGDEAKPRCWWWWFGDTVTKAGITHDLEAMKEMGLGGASICANHWFELEPGPVKCLSDDWYDCVVWAGKEADRLGLTLGFHNCPGWCNTGGPWVRPEFAQKHLVWTETSLDGGRPVDVQLPKAKAPFGIYRPVAVLAIPDREAAVTFTGEPRDYRFDHPRTVTSLEMTIADFTYGLNCVSAPEYVVSVSDDGINFREHWRTTETRAETVHTLTFPAVRTKAIRLSVAKGVLPKITQVKVLSAPRIPHAHRKSFGSFVWEWPLVPQETFDCPSEAVIRQEEVIDLSDCVSSDGRLSWNAPAGKWIVFNFASTVMDYAVNHVATPSGVGLECDKLSAAGVEEGARGPVTRIPELARQHGIKAFRTVHIDSSEAPAPNWTERMPEEFRALRGYDLRKFLPVMAGRTIGSTSVSERFLRDFRLTVNDLMVRYWGGHYASLMHEKGLEFEFQSYNWPFNQLEMAQHADIPMGEFWVHTGAGANDATRLAATQGDVYGRRIVSCEAFTDGCGKVMSDDNEDIDDLRREGDRRFANGINRFVIHAYTHQPYDDPALRTNYWHFGIRIDRHHPKFSSFKPWIDYLTETQAKLQEGRGVADAVVLAREDAPLDRADWEIPDPYGYRSDVLERKLFLSSLEFREGRLRLPSGMDYRLLVLPKTRELTPAVLRKTRALVKAGANVLLGPRPVSSSSLTGYPQCDVEVEAVAKELWDACPETGSAPVGKGRVWRGVKLIDVYREIGLDPDFVATENGRPVKPDEVVYTHRRTANGERYFISNVTKAPKELEIRFRGGHTRKLSLGASKSCFIDL